MENGVNYIFPPFLFKIKYAGTNDILNLYSVLTHTSRATVGDIPKALVILQERGGWKSFIP